MKGNFNRVFMQAVRQLKKKAPKDTGNLAYDAIKYEWVSENEFRIYVDLGSVPLSEYDGQRGIAPYMPVTNETWISPRWNGKKNPNENWWNEAVDFIVHYIAKRLKGKLK